MNALAAISGFGKTGLAFLKVAAQGEMAMDPLTAGLNFGTAFMNFLVTPAGQRLADANLKLVTDIMGHTHLLSVKATGVSDAAA